jgi:hypothetical protein
MNNELEELCDSLIWSNILVFPDGTEKTHEKLSKNNGSGTEIRILDL